MPHNRRFIMLLPCFSIQVKLRSGLNIYHIALVYRAGVVSRKTE
jgi:hypothetical protein